MSGRELCFLSLAEQARLIRDREVSPVEVVASTLRQIERVDKHVNAYITVMGESALEGAKEAEREIAAGRYRGPLHGIPIALKDLLYTKGVRTTGGSKILRDFVPEEDATVVARLKEAGAVILGKANMHEFAIGPLNTNPHYGDAHNPWDLGRITGGSSGGSAAAAVARMASGTLGTDTGGSIRIPSCLCGIVGLKPTYGRVSRNGCLPCSWSLDHIGPMCRTAEDAALLLGPMSGWDPKDPSSSREPVPDYAAEITRDVAGMKVALLHEYVHDPVEPDIAAGFQAAVEVLRGLGVTVEEVSTPEVEAAVAPYMVIMYSELTTWHDEFLHTRPQDYGQDVRARVELGALMSATDYLKGQRIRTQLIDRFLPVFRRYDALLCPTEPVTAFRFEDALVGVAGPTEPRTASLVRHTRAFDLLSVPALTVPCGFASDGLPMGLEIVGAPFAEGTLLRLAHAYQRATDWHLRVPPVAAP